MSSGSFCFYDEKGSKKYFVVNYGKELKNRRQRPAVLA